MACKIMYEVSLDVGVPPSRTQRAIRGDGIMRSVVFTRKKSARSFQADHPGAKLRAVEICETSGKIKRRGKRTFTGRRRR